MNPTLKQTTAAKLGNDVNAEPKPDLMPPQFFSIPAKVRAMNDGDSDANGLEDLPLDVLVSLSITERKRLREVHAPHSLSDYRKLARGCIDKSRELDERGDHAASRCALRLALTVLCDATTRTDLRKTIVMPQPKVTRENMLDYVWCDGSAVCEVRSSAKSEWKAFDGKHFVRNESHPKGLWPSSHEAARALEARGVGPAAKDIALNAGVLDLTQGAQ